MAAKPIDQTLPSVTPYLMVNGADAAIAFYKKAFGATEVMRLTDPAGKIAHAQVKIGEAPVMLAEETKEWGNRSPQTLGGTPVIIDLCVADVDVVVERAVAAGARLVFPVADQFYGFRSGRISDPFGHVWIVSTQKEDLTTEEMQRRFDAMMKKQP
jgi:PhnB protein